MFGIKSSTIFIQTLIFYFLQDWDTADLVLYEEVARMPPFQRKSLVLVGANGVGRRSLKERLIKSDPRIFAGAMPRKCL